MTEASHHTDAANRAVAADLPLADPADLGRVRHGRLGGLDRLVVHHDRSGRPILDTADWGGAAVAEAIGRQMFDRDRIDEALEWFRRAAPESDPARTPSRPIAAWPPVPPFTAVGTPRSPARATTATPSRVTAVRVRPSPTRRTPRRTRRSPRPAPAATAATVVPGNHAVIAVSQRAGFRARPLYVKG